MISYALNQVQKVNGRQRTVFYFNCLKEANQEKAVTAQEFPTEETRSLVTDTMTNSQPGEATRTDGHRANILTIFEQTRVVGIPSQMVMAKGHFWKFPNQTQMITK